MLIIQEILLSDDIVEKQFLCDLNACKGACCWEGDYGAPLENAERDALASAYPRIAPFLTPEGRDAISQQGTSVYYPEAGEHGTPLLPNAACAYMTTDENGIAQCGIELAQKTGATSFQKPISCHLYPVRISTNVDGSFEALNYDRWDICQAACTLGKQHKLPVYQFVKAALIRKYGADFYEELHAAATYLEKGKD